MMKYLPVSQQVARKKKKKAKKRKSCSTGKFDRKAHPSIPSQKFGSFDGCCFSDGVLIDELKRKKYNWSLKC